METITMDKPGFFNFLMTLSKPGEKVSESKVPLVLLPQKACFRTFEGPENLSGPYTGHEIITASESFIPISEG